MQHAIVSEVFQDFLRTLQAEQAIGQHVIDRLRATLLDRQEYRTDDLRDALFSEEELP